MHFEITILGNGSATPTFQRHPSAQVLRVDDRVYLIDCGEGTQMQMGRYKVKSHRIMHIFISHLHGDHYLGLMGLLSSMHLQGRTTELHIYAHRELQSIIEYQMEVSHTRLRYPLVFHWHENIKGHSLFEDDHITVEPIPLEHRIPCVGFLFREKPRPVKLKPGVVEKYRIPYEAIESIKSGSDFTDSQGNVIASIDLTMPPSRQRSYAYCSDTLYNKAIEQKVRKVDVLYHETTFMHDLLERANETFHTTSLQAGMLANNAEIGKLLIGHFSARYSSATPLLEEARMHFPNAEVAEEGMTYAVE
jgi:ribonuclease Z